MGSCATTGTNTARSGNRRFFMPQMLTIFPDLDRGVPRQLSGKKDSEQPMASGDGLSRNEEPRLRVLLIEDFPPVVRALKLGLEEEGFAVEVAGDEQDGYG